MSRQGSPDKIPHHRTLCICPDPHKSQGLHRDYDPMAVEQDSSRPRSSSYMNVYGNKGLKWISIYDSNKATQTIDILPILWGCTWKGLPGSLSGGNLLFHPYIDRPRLWPVWQGYPDPLVCNGMRHLLRCNNKRGVTLDWRGWTHLFIAITIT